MEARGTSSPSSKILVVDDTEATRYALSRVLRNEGFEVQTASTGMEALKLADEFSPDLITLDIHLPDISGFDVCRKIKADPKKSHIAILQISASYVTDKDKIYGLDGGADSYLVHPVDSNVLVSTINALLRIRNVSASLRESEEMLQLAVRSTHVGTWDYCPDNGKLVWSDRCREIFGFGKDEQVTYDMYVARLHPDDRDMMLKKISAVLNGEDSEINVEHRVVHPDGKVLWVQGRGAIYSLEDSSTKTSTRIIGTVLDITDRKLAMDELSNAKDLAENASRTKTQFIANVSHEIRTPLGAILGFTDIVLESTDVSSENLYYLSIIKRNAQQLSKLIDEILDLSKVEADRMIIEKIPVNIAELVQDVIAVMKIKAQEKGLELFVTFEGPTPLSAMTDPNRLRQILINLLMNSVKFTDKGRVELRLSVTEPLSKNQPVHMRFDVIDSGIGISPEQVGQLFQAFVQADSSMTRRFGGTGLGLNLSRKLSQLLGGTLTLSESALGKGSTFTLIIDAGLFDGTLAGAEPTGAVASAQRQIYTPDKTFLKDKKVLVVEDARDNQLILERILSLYGATVEVASNGNEGIVKALAHTYDIVLMDIQMPQLNGYEAVNQLREKKYMVPIIALTAHALKGERERCLDSGFSDYMTKPIDRKLLLNKIHQLTQ